MATAMQRSEQEGTRFISGLVTEPDLDAYRRDGAVCIRGVVPFDDIEGMREATARVIALRREAGTLGREGGSEPSDGPAFHNLLHVAADDPVFERILMHSAVPAVARDLMQSGKVIVFGDSLLVKEPGAKRTTPWHHDMPYWPVRGEQVSSIWIAMDHVSRENGGMEYVAGSHRWNRMFRPRYFDGTDSGDQRFELIPDFDAAREDYRFVSWDLAPGDVLIHQGLSVHGAGENKRADMNRRAFAPRYVGDAAWWDPAFASARGGSASKNLQFGDALDVKGAHPVALDLT